MLGVWLRDSNRAQEDHGLEEDVLKISNARQELEKYQYDSVFVCAPRR